jgi:hypothetical protein
MKYGRPIPKSAMHARPTSGSDKLERKQSTLDGQTDCEHQRQRNQEDQALDPSSLPKMTDARNGPRGEA